MKNILIISAFICALSACSNSEKNSTAQPQTDSTKILQSDIKKVTSVARIEPEKGLLYIYANTNGSIAKILVKENQKLAQGSLLLTLDNATDKALLEVEQSKISAQVSAIEATKQNEASIKKDLDKAKSDFALNKQLFEAKAITQLELNDSEVKIEKLSSDYAKAVADKNQQISKMEEVKANVNYREKILDEKQVKTILPGKVLQWNVHNGDYVTQGQKLGQFAPEGDLVAVMEVDELFQDKVKNGMKAEVFSQLNGEKIDEGTVIYVADFLKKKSLFSDDNTVEDRRVKEVKIRLNSNYKAIINSKVDCSIYLK